MKKLSFLVLLTLISFNSFANETLKMQLLDYKQGELDHSLELVTTSIDFDKIVLDCHSFITGMNFMKEGYSKSEIYLDMFTCESTFELILESKKENKPLCIELDPINNSLTFSRKTANCQ